MSVNSKSAAKWLCEASGWKITNLALQKLLYLSHMYHMGRIPGNPPLVDEEFEAWDYGPVLPRVYHTVKGFGSGPIGNVFNSVGDIDDEEAIASLQEVYVALKDTTAGRLVSMTHRDNGAWSRTYDRNARRNKIPNELILEEFADLIADAA